MNRQSFVNKFSIWAFFSFIVLLLGIVLWDVPIGTAVLLAGLWGLVIFLRLGLHAERGPKIVEEIKSDDGVVTATIADFSNEKSKIYLAKVIRNYEANVFAKEKEFTSLQQALQWLNTTYHLEMEKHSLNLQNQPTD